jgi:hypothetical protein
MGLNQEKLQAYLAHPGIPEQEKVALIQQIQSHAPGMQIPQWTKLGVNSLGQDIWGWQNPVTGEIKVAPVGAGVGGPAGNAGFLDPNLTAEAAMNMAPPEIQVMAKKFAKYEEPIPTGRAAADPKIIASMALAEKLNPGFSSIEYASQKSLNESFKSKKDAEEVKSYSTVMGHISRAYQNVDAVGNTTSPAVNYVRNAVRAQYDQSYQDAIGRINADMDTAINEYNRATTGKPVTVDERKSWHEKLNENSSPVTMKATLKEFLDLIDSRMESTAAKWNNGMNLKEGDAGYRTPSSLLSPHAREQYELVKSGKTPLAPTDSPTGQSAAQPPQLTEDQYRQAPSGTKFTAPDGTVRVKP